MTELEIKQKRLGEFLDRHQLGGVLLTNRNNFAWITCGRDNHIANNTPVGVASIFATRDSRVCLANSIEAPRMKLEELQGTGIETIDFAWYDDVSARRALSELVGGKHIAGDVDFHGSGVAPLPGGFNELRWSLTDEEIARYREGAKRASAAMEKTCRQLEHAMNEHQVAGLLDHEIHNAGLNPVVTLIASDDRIANFRHPIPVDKTIKNYVMLVTCAEFAGLVTSLTRFVSFGKLSEELAAKAQSIADVDAAVNLATRPGRALGEIFADLQAAYATIGQPDQWKLHHQGGPAGYAPREAIGTPGNGIKTLENQAFAWNPSVVGIKSEDTILSTSKGIEVLSAHSKDWPTLTGHAGSQTLARAGVLVL